MLLEGTMVTANSRGLKLAQAGRETLYIELSILQQVKLFMGITLGECEECQLFKGVMPLLCWSNLS